MNFYKQLIIIRLLSRAAENFAIYFMLDVHIFLIECLLNESKNTLQPKS